ncbi:hypothetical protein L1267_23385 [Pseudoalteromonas sp. OFAV1]|uniref:hypothetical protein n=1 Tax=Pseudoalteromonas sp. OFAV1 TaxID=2908892 RepID=UPI001F437EF7|nr:hypothetical protein [Pseudoalteromonas sp. OFAV1]MCF2903315.1 hypothetical protein [Pseudoalteromonas sp. OFAV1]
MRQLNVCRELAIALVDIYDHLSIDNKEHPSLIEGVIDRHTLDFDLLLDKLTDQNSDLMMNAGIVLDFRKALIGKHEGDDIKITYKLERAKSF